ncbi:MAG: hypothetical protein WA005_03275, partial [Candidatus Binataceae bacterium]
QGRSRAKSSDLPRTLCGTLSAGRPGREANLTRSMFRAFERHRRASAHDTEEPIRSELRRVQFREVVACLGLSSEVLVAARL